LSFLQAIILGIVQGLTEFLPVSSSGHLVIFEHLLGTSLDSINFDVFAHTGTLLSVIIYYRHQIASVFSDIMNNSTRRGTASPSDSDISPAWVWYIIIATIPAGIMGLLFEDYITTAFKSIRLVGCILLFCGLLLISTKWVRTGNRKLRLTDAILIGIAQAFAIAPGLSRSGTTISMGLFRKINPKSAADFSFLLSIPAVAGATVLKTKTVLAAVPPADEILNYAVGAITSFIIGYLSISLLLRMVQKGKFFYFGIYCFLIGTAVLIFV